MMYVRVVANNETHNWKNRFYNSNYEQLQAIKSELSVYSINEN
ncbi:hypothetical protein VCR6J2_240084 [Vibrio coralliirubri]|nr:hypothetical protein VCR6J2_240084 [Vibrio coralliirubri]